MATPERVSKTIPQPPAPRRTIQPVAAEDPTDIQSNLPMRRVAVWSALRVDLSIHTLGRLPPKGHLAMPCPLSVSPSSCALTARTTSSPGSTTWIMRSAQIPDPTHMPVIKARVRPGEPGPDSGPQRTPPSRVQCCRQQSAPAGTRQPGTTRSRTAPANRMRPFRAHPTELDQWLQFRNVRPTPPLPAP